MKFSDIDTPSNRSFGFLFSFIFLALALYLFYNNYLKLTLILMILSVVFLVISLVKAQLLHPMNKAWMALGLALGLIVSPIVVCTIYFVLITPVALITKMFGRDELRIKMDRNKSSHWVDCSSVSDNFFDFKRQF
ncbi:MAG: SxtJ family membrane protein [Lentilitoribacter sp.]